MTAHIFEKAHQRGASLPYAGAVTATEAFELLQTDSRIYLVDVRTDAERDWVGQVIINPIQLHVDQWNLYPSRVNPDFLTELARIAGTDTVILFLCRSGVRSRAAAQLATEHGYTACYDILAGFEGDKDENGHRKTVSGWCFDGLPWRGA